MCERERDGGQGRDDHCVTRAQYIYWDSKLLKVLFTHRYTWQIFWFNTFASLVALSTNFSVKQGRHNCRHHQRLSDAQSQISSSPVITKNSLISGLPYKSG